MINVEGLTKSFGPQKVLRELSLEIATGTITIVIGRSGGGKSVFLKHLIGLMRPDAGRIMVDGVDISRLRGRALDEIRRAYGVVFQGGALFDSMSCFDNVAFPLREKVRTPPDELTKRVAIARALVTEPEIIFFDEPTTGLDPVLVNTIHHLILDLHRRFRFTAVVVSHEIPEIFEIADTVAMLHEGRIVEVGPPAAIQGSTNPVVQRFIKGEPDNNS